jgi:hypothetical protein
MFDGMLERIHDRCKFEGTMASQVDRLSASAQFMVKIADGYTQKTFYQRKNLLDFLEKDVLNDSNTGDTNLNVIKDIDDNVFGEEMRRRTIARLNK